MAGRDVLIDQLLELESIFPRNIAYDLYYNIIYRPLLLGITRVRRIYPLGIFAAILVRDFEDFRRIYQSLMYLEELWKRNQILESSRILDEKADQLAEQLNEMMIQFNMTEDDLPKMHRDFMQAHKKFLAYREKANNKER